MEAGKPLPMLVFDCAPTIQEAKQATSELNDALEIAYLSPSTNRLKDSSEVTPSAQNHALEAFTFLHENPAAQNVVASISSDPNVWSAVLQNKEVVNFFQSHKTSGALPDADPNLNDSFTCNEIPSPEDAKKSEEGEKGFMDYVVEKATIGAALMGLAIMVIMVVVLKRP